jgi:hypothetical protein
LISIAEAEWFERRFVDERDTPLRRERVDVMESLCRMATAMNGIEVA